MAFLLSSDCHQLLPLVVELDFEFVEFEGKWKLENGFSVNIVKLVQWISEGMRIWVIFSFRRRKNLCNLFTSNKGENSHRIWEKIRKEDEDCCVIVERGWLISFVPVYITGEQRSRYRILFKRQKKIENKRRQGSREQRTIYQNLTRYKKEFSPSIR